LTSARAQSNTQGLVSHLQTFAAGLMPKYIEGRYLNSLEKTLKSTMALLDVSKAEGGCNKIIK